MERKIKVIEKQNDKRIYTLMTYFIGGGTLGGYTQNRSGEYSIDTDKSLLYWDIDDVRSKLKVEEIDLINNTFKQKNKLYHFKFVD